MADLLLPDAGTLQMGDGSLGGEPTSAAVLTKPPLLGLYFLAASGEGLSQAGVGGSPLWINFTAGVITKLAPRCSSAFQPAASASIDACPKASNPLVVSPLQAVEALAVYVSATDGAGNLATASLMSTLNG